MHHLQSSIWSRCIIACTCGTRIAGWFWGWQSTLHSRRKRSTHIVCNLLLLFHSSHILLEHCWNQLELWWSLTHKSKPLKRSVVVIASIRLVNLMQVCVDFFFLFLFSLSFTFFSFSYSVSCPSTRGIRHQLWRLWCRVHSPAHSCLSNNSFKLYCLKVQLVLLTFIFSI